MADILSYVTPVFTNIFGANGYIAGIISLVTSNGYLMVGLALMVAGSAVGFLSRLIRNS